jgi:putative DNA primase/helicase
MDVCWSEQASWCGHYSHKQARFVHPGSVAQARPAELPGILNWAIRGCLEWQRDGLKDPKAVRDAVSAYRSDSDLLAEFIDEECAVDPAASTATLELYGRYKFWAESRGTRYPMTMSSFSRRLQDRGYRKEKDSKTRRAIIRGLKVPDLKGKS